ncbi:hypothetical protein [Hymenobacter weizhouensis]|uniref:hypothetical protein n=1 Tax=Hymenobacter sp. YIM 151500-1 TaxID=2987689 RepID=UPI002225E769|nr:hypothetical protein [Hymenobacter sp. YIM 151500-1]UYZ61588.1 hypothetical protein OIS53_11275 [Hymenobacter sp. YIM 151500-1]
MRLPVLLHLASAQPKHLYRWLIDYYYNEAGEMLRLRGRQMKQDGLATVSDSFKTKKP